MAMGEEIMPITHSYIKVAFIGHKFYKAKCDPFMAITLPVTQIPDPSN